MWTPPSLQLYVPHYYDCHHSLDDNDDRHHCGVPAVSRAVLSRIHCFLWTHIGPPPLQLTNTAAVSSDDVDVDVDGNADVDGNVDVDGDVGGDDDDNDLDHNWTLCTSSFITIDHPNSKLQQAMAIFYV